MAGAGAAPEAALPAAPADPMLSLLLRVLLPLSVRWDEGSHSAILTLPNLPAGTWRMDVSTQVRSIAQVARALESGGVGYYPRRNFVHIDVGDVRTWTA